MQSSLILSLNARMASSSSLTSLFTILSDIFVFLYPLYLVYLYLWTHDQISRWQRLLRIATDRAHKYQALNIFTSFVGVFFVNYIIKAFVTQSRPFVTLDLAHNPQDALILNKIPSDAFPSDHAAASMTMAVAVLIRWYRTNNRSMKMIGRSFFGFSLIMWFTRVTTGLHRPVDIIAGYTIGTIIAYVVTHPRIVSILQTKIYDPLIDLQEKMFSHLKSFTR